MGITKRNVKKWIILPNYMPEYLLMVKLPITSISIELQPEVFPDTVEVMEVDVYEPTRKVYNGWEYKYTGTRRQ